MINLNLPEELTSPPNASVPLDGVNPKVEILMQNPYVEHMLRALESERGIAIDCEDNRAAKLVRFRCYSQRRKLVALNIRSLDDIIIRVIGSSVEIVKGPSTVVRDL